MTPVEWHQEPGVWLKRDDTFRVGNATGGKARSILALVQATQPRGLVAYGSRDSTQVVVAAEIARHVGIPARILMPWAGQPPTASMVAVEKAGAELVLVRPGYLSVLSARSRVDAEGRGWLHVPSGPAVMDAVVETASQVANLPAEASRIVVPVGSGMTLCGVLQGLEARGDMRHVVVVGVVTGGNPTVRLDRWAPPLWRARTRLIGSDVGYAKHVSAVLAGVPLDPVYEAKCARFVQAGDVLWCVGNRGP